MRILKFRAWARRSDNFEDDGEHRKFEMIPADSLAFELYMPLSELLVDIEDDIYFMQFTGLKDSNDNEIYEGDILSGHSDGNVRVEWVNEAGGYECIFSDESNIGIAEMCVWFGNDSEIIGNIYENPDLIK